MITMLVGIKATPSQIALATTAELSNDASTNMAGLSADFDFVFRFLIVYSCYFLKRFSYSSSLTSKKSSVVI